MEALQSIFSMNMLLATLRLAIPLTLASIGGVLCERSGIINLGIEGMMLMGSFGAVVGSHISGNPWIGVLFGIAVGGLFGCPSSAQIVEMFNEIRDDAFNHFHAHFCGCHILLSTYKLTHTKFNVRVVF